jgi:hypothetical protein
MLTKEEILFHKELIKCCNLENNKLRRLIQQKIWPKFGKKHKYVIGILQKYISYLSLKGEDDMALNLVNLYSLSPLARIISINKMFKSKKGLYWILKKYKIYNKIKILNLKMGRSILVNVSNPFLNNILQIQLCFLLDSFYEAKYPVLMFGQRKGRSNLHSVSFLYGLLKKYCILKSFGLIYINLQLFCYNIDKKFILKYVLVPVNWFGSLILWSKLLAQNIQKKKSIGFFYKNIGFALILNVLLLRSFEFFFSSYYHTNSITVRHVVIHNNYIFFLTNKISELFYLIQKFKKALTVVGFILKWLFYRFFLFRHKFTLSLLSFNFLGYTYNFVFKKYNLLFFKLFISITPALKTVKKIKAHCKSIIISLRHLNVLNVFFVLNQYLLKVVFYFAFTCGFLKLFRLDFFILFLLKKYLIKKYRFKGVRRPKWVFHNFVFLNKNSYLSQNYILNSWHPFVLLVNKTFTILKQYKNFFLILTSKLLKKVSILIYNNNLLFYLYPYYLFPFKYLENIKKIQKKRGIIK